MNVEEEYEDVLQNIEFTIVSVFRSEPELVDYDVDAALSALRRGYRQSEAPSAAPAHFTHEQRVLYEQVKRMCDWRLGRGDLPDADMPADLRPEPLKPEEMVLCLKRIQRSIQMWSKRGGRQGYLTFISDFIA